MTIRIDSISSFLTNIGYRWELSVKGLYGKGIYFTASTGLNGLGLYASSGEIETGTDSYRRVESLSPLKFPTIELVAPERFHVHEECDATAVVQRVATALVMLGWGPELIDDRDAISDRRSVMAHVLDVRRLVTDTKDQS